MKSNVQERDVDQKNESQIPQRKCVDVVYSLENGLTDSPAPFVCVSKVLQPGIVVLTQCLRAAHPPCQCHYVAHCCQ